ncbi:MAG: hypothetical protein JWQ54_5017 [Mucilaginibacter sp.]|nr:hypothetical protein [Mucilaginibacter sp.]
MGIVSGTLTTVCVQARGLDGREANLDNVEMELFLRYVMDALGKHMRWYYEEIFNGTAVIDMGTPGFEVKTFKKRINVKP